MQVDIFNDASIYRFDKHGLTNRIAVALSIVFRKFFVSYGAPVFKDTSNNRNKDITKDIRKIIK